MRFIRCLSFILLVYIVLYRITPDAIKNTVKEAPCAFDGHFDHSIPASGLALAMLRPCAANRIIFLQTKRLG